MPVIWHYLKGKAASQGACLVPAPAAVVQKASISTDLSMEYFSLGDKEVSQTQRPSLWDWGETGPWRIHLLRPTWSIMEQQCNTN